jgi:hypothetical protein
MGVMLAIMVSSLDACLGGTVLRDDFDDREFSDTLWFKDVDGTGNVSFLDGYAFLNISNETEAGELADSGILTHGLPYRYAIFEARLRCSDDNKMESDVGGGYRYWGFYDRTSKSFINFACASPESGEQYEGFRVFSAVGGDIKLWRRISGVDITEWHTYKIVWEPGNGTFLVDGEVVATTAEVPENGMGVVIHNTNREIRSPFHGHTYQYIDIPFDESIQIDYVHIFSVPETAILPLLPIVALLGFTLRRRRPLCLSTA